MPPAGLYTNEDLEDRWSSLNANSMSAVANINAAQLQEKRRKKKVCGKYRANHHETNRGEGGSQPVKNSAGTHRDVSQCFPSRCLALLDQVSSELPGPPACVMETSGNAEVFGTGGDAHRKPKSAQVHEKVASRSFSQKTPACCWAMSFVDVQPDKLFSRCRCGVWWKGVCVNCM